MKLFALVIVGVLGATIATTSTYSTPSYSSSYYTSTGSVSSSSNTLRCDSCMGMVFSGEGSETLNILMQMSEEMSCETTESTRCNVQSGEDMCRTLVLDYRMNGTMQGIGLVDLNVAMTMKGCTPSWMSCDLFMAMMGSESANMFDSDDPDAPDLDVEFTGCELDGSNSDYTTAAHGDTGASMLRCDTCMSLEFSGYGGEVYNDLVDLPQTCEAVSMACSAGEDSCRTAVLVADVTAHEDQIGKVPAGAAPLTVDATEKGCMPSAMTCGQFEADWRARFGMVESGKPGEYIKADTGELIRFKSCWMSSAQGFSPYYVIYVELALLLMMSLL